MARRGSSKARSVAHEEWIAWKYDGVRSPSSGAWDTDQGDVRSERLLIECKTTGTPEKPSTLPVFIQHLEKVVDEAWSESREGAVALRYYQPASKLADRDGWVDVIVHTVTADADREALCVVAS
jgi:hypothetical protein